LSPNGFSAEFCQTIKEELTPMLLFRKIRRKGMFPNSFCEAGLLRCSDQIRVQQQQKKKINRLISLMNVDAKILSVILANPI
jgi:hypothetical protein